MPFVRKRIECVAFKRFIAIISHEIKKSSHEDYSFLFGGAYRARTGDLHNAIVARSQLR